MKIYLVAIYFDNALHSIAGIFTSRPKALARQKEFQAKVDETGGLVTLREYDPDTGYPTEHRATKRRGGNR